MVISGYWWLSVVMDTSLSSVLHFVSLSSCAVCFLTESTAV